MGIIIGIRAGIGGGKRKPDKWLDPVSAEFTRRTSGGSLSVGSRAKIGSVKGRTLVWNQMVKNGDFGTGDISGWNISSQSLTAVVNNGVCEIIKSASGGMYMSQRINLVEGHKYFLSCDLKAYNNKVSVFIRDATADEYYCRTSISSDFDKFHRIREAFVSVGSNTRAEVRFNDTNTSDFQTYYVKNVMLIDLTLLGLDSLSADEFAKLYPADYYPSTYTGDNYANFTPRLINNIASAIKTTGFNQWNEQWEAGGIYQDNGQSSPTSGYYRSKGYIPILPNTTYYIKSPVGMNIFFYGINQEYLGYSLLIANKTNSTFTTPQGAFFMRFRNFSKNWEPYNNDVCINFSCPRNGEYQRYWENSLALNLTTITGKAGGDSVVIFPDGMKSVGNIYDELTKTTATKRIGSQVVSGSAGDAITLVGCDTTALSYVCATNIGTLSGGVLTLSADVSGVAVYFALATPEVYTLDSPLSLSYRVDSFGTEERLPADTPSELSAPIRIEVSYTEPKAKDIKPVLSGPLLGAGGDNNETQYETDS